MTYVSLQVFTECMRSTGIQDKDEYQELYDHGILPTKLMPRSPSTHYLPKIKRIKIKRNTNKLFEEKYGRKLNPNNKEDYRLRRKIYSEIPEVKAHRAVYHQLPEVVAKRKTDEYKARHKAYLQNSKKI